MSELDAKVWSSCLLPGKPQLEVNSDIRTSRAAAPRLGSREVLPSKGIKPSWLVLVSPQYPWLRTLQCISTVKASAMMITSYWSFFGGPHSELRIFYVVSQVIPLQPVVVQSSLL